MPKPADISATAYFKQHEFTLFDRIIHGDLSPSTLSSINSHDYLKELQSRQNDFYRFTIADYRKNKGKLVLKDQRTLFCLHPSAIWLRSSQPTLFENSISGQLDSGLLEELGIPSQTVLNYAFSKENHKITLYLKQPAALTELSSLEIKFYFYSKLLYDEVERIKFSIKNNVIKCDLEEQTKHYIHKQQHALASLFLQIHKVLAPTNFNDIYTQALEYSPKDILNLTYAYLEHLIRFLEKNYLKYVDSNIEIAHRTALIKYYGIEYKFKRVKAALTNAQLSPKILEALFKPFTKIDALYGPEKITYRELNYFNTYISYIQEFLQHTETITDIKLFQLLVAINYNSLNVLSLRVDFIQTQMETFNTTETKIDFLYHELKSLNQVQQYSQLAYSPNLPSLKTQITLWLEEEIQYNSRKLVPKKPLQQNYPLNNPDKVKIKSGLPVSQLAYFFRLLSDVGIIDHKNQRDIFRFLADNFITSKTSDISPDSISSKYYTPEGATVDEVRGKIIELLNRSNLD